MHAFHWTDWKDPDIHILDRWMPATKHTQHSPSWKMERDHIYDWIKNGLICKTLIQNDESQRSSWERWRRRKMWSVDQASVSVWTAGTIGSRNDRPTPLFGPHYFFFYFQICLLFLSFHLVSKCISGMCMPRWIYVSTLRENSQITCYLTLVTVYSKLAILLSQYTANLLSYCVTVYSILTILLSQYTAYLLSYCHSIQHTCYCTVILYSILAILPIHSM